MGSNAIKRNLIKCVKDPTADPVSAVLIKRGVKTSSGNPIQVKMLNSRLLVYTRLKLRPNTSSADKQNQINTFNDIIERVLNE